MKKITFSEYLNEFVEETTLNDTEISNDEFDVETQFEDSDLDEFCYLEDNFTNEDLEILLEKVRTKEDRLKTQAMKNALNIATKGDYSNWDINKQAMFRAKYEYFPMGIRKGKFVKRKKPLDVQKLKKNMKKKSKSMKKLMKSKGKSMARKAQLKKGR